MNRADLQVAIVAHAAKASNLLGQAEKTSREGRRLNGGHEDMRTIALASAHATTSQALFNAFLMTDADETSDD